MDALALLALPVGDATPLCWVDPWSVAQPKLVSLPCCRRSERSTPPPPRLSPPRLQVVAALLQIGLIDGAGTLLADPRYTKLTWRAQLAALVPELTSTGDSLRADASHVSGEATGSCCRGLGGRAGGHVGGLPVHCRGGRGACAGLVVVPVVAALATCERHPLHALSITLCCSRSHAQPGFCIRLCQDCQP